MAVLLEIKKKMPGGMLDVSYESLSGRIGILGESGSGKSMLLKCIAGIEKPDFGEIQIHGKTVYDSVRHQSIKVKKRNVGYLPLGYALFPGLSVEENILCGYRGVRANKERMAMEFIRRFELTELEDKDPQNLSERIRFRTAAARMLIGEPQLLLLDEPFLGQEGSCKEDLKTDFDRFLMNYEKGFILTSKDPEEIYQFCDSVILLERGKVLAAGPVREIFKNPMTIEIARLLGFRNFSRAEIIDEYHIQALDWGIALRTEKQVDEKIRYVGIRSEDMKAAEGNSQNTLQIRKINERFGINQNEYEVSPVQENGSTLFWRTEGTMASSAAIYLPPEKLIFME